MILAGTEATAGEVEGVSLTARAFGAILGGWSESVLVLVVVMFALSTMISYSYYGKKCFAYLFGARRAARNLCLLYTARRGPCKGLAKE